MRSTCVFLFLAILLLAGCSRRPDALEPNEYVRWIASDNGGLIFNRMINGVTIRARFLPPDYLAYREFKEDKSTPFDSLRKTYACGLAFQISISADKGDQRFGNLMYSDITNNEEYLSRERYLSFQSAEFVSLQSNGKTYIPTLTNFEGYDPISNRLSFQAVFAMEEYNCGNVLESFNEIVLIFEDPYWQTGTTKFAYSRSNILSIPKLKI